MQSTAVLVLSAQGIIDYPVHVFASVGDRAESAATIAYVRDVLKPYAEMNGIKWIEVCKRDKHGAAVDLLDKIEQPNSRSVLIPVRMAGSGAPGNRSCTVDWKIQPVAKMLKALIPCDVVKRVNRDAKAFLLSDNAQAEISRRYDRAAMALNEFDPKIMKKVFDQLKLETKQKLYFNLFPVSLGKGISTDEAQRAKPETGFAHYTASYPLIDLRLSRMDCVEIIRKAGLPPAPKSACWFCPYKTKPGWQALRDSDPQQFAQAVALEKMLYEKSVDLGRGGCYFTSTGTVKQMFLDEVTSPHFQQDLFHGFDDGECESGYCWT